MTKVSIIVPAYDAQRYLPACLHSALAQTHEDVEVVCVNDGSTDATAGIVASFAGRDARVRLLQKENGGPSSARNAGVAVATGDVLLFLDADDELDPQACERVVQEFDRQPCDAVVFGWTYFPAAQADRFVREHADVRDAFYPAFDPDLLFCENSNPYLRVAVRREALEQSGVRFDEGLTVGEDAQFLFALFPRIGGVRLIPDKLYAYRLPRPGSLMAQNKPDDASLCACDANAMAAIFADWKGAGLLGRYGAQLMRWYVRNPLYTMLRLHGSVRDELVALTKQLWLANFSEAEVRALHVDAATLRLVDIVLGAADDGTLAVDDRELARALLDWRIAEYGVADFAVTAADRMRFAVAHSPLAQGGPQRREALARRMRAKSHALGSAAAEPSHDSADVPAFAPDAPEAGEALEPARAPEAGDTPLVSVIVPVYNVERYLDQALCSVEAQTLRNMEIICVDDGSTDASAAIMRDHAARDPRVRVVSKENGGYGSACNCGLAQARGTWIAIVEPDDWIEPDMYRAMTDFAATFAVPIDVVKTPYWRVWLPDANGERTVNCSYRGRIRPKGQPFKLGDPGTVHLIIHHPSIWSALYRRSFVERTGLKFREIPGAGWADNPFLAESLCQAESIAYLDTPFYHYREETPEKTAAFGRSGWRTSVDRWHDMMDVYERLGVQEPSIRRAHVRRGFTYAGLILEYHSADDPEIRQALAGMFARMDDDLVFGEPNLSPGSKELYARVKGVQAPRSNPLPYVARVVQGGLYNLANTGMGMTLDTLRTFVSAHAKREGR